MNYYFTNEDETGDYITADGTRVSIKEVAPERVHIPEFRDGELSLYDSKYAFLLDNNITPSKGAINEL